MKATTVVVTVVKVTKMVGVQQRGCGGYDDNNCGSDIGSGHDYGASGRWGSCYYNCQGIEMEEKS